MGKYFVDITQDAKKDIALIYKSGDKNSIKRLEKFFQNYRNNLKLELASQNG